MWKVFNLVFYSLFTLCSAYFAVIGDISYATSFSVRVERRLENTFWNGGQ
jgi:hypothetical protein